MARKFAFCDKVPSVKIDVPGPKVDALHSGPARQARNRAYLRKLESRLEYQEHFNRSVLNSLAANVAVIDENGTITDTNHAWLAFAAANGNPPEEKIGSGANYFDVCRRAEGPQAWIAMAALEGISGVLRGEREFFEMEYPCHSPDVKRWFIVRATPLAGYKGERVVVTHFDITDRVLAREAMEKAQEELEERIRQRTAELEEARAKAELYVDVMAHDIGNMGQIALGYLEMAGNILRAAPNPDKNALSMLSQSTGTLDEIARLIGNIRKTRTGMPGARQVVDIDIGDLLERVRTQYRSIPGREVNIHIENTCDCHVMANDLLYEVFSNLVGNSIKHSEGRVNITIRIEWYSENEKRLCQVSIEDDGPGIPDHMKEEVLHCRGTRHQGSRARGLGICLSRMLIGEFHGQLRLEDRIQGDYSKGVRAVVVLPAV
ncbi:ATP-binding protein [Methanocella sp. MCL-LM]|uniref:ATP-binding protein n=1 Tax=Methanocella sp. MCL-LM TaxID=3412035 RepID=UPI003C711D1E